MMKVFLPYYVCISERSESLNIQSELFQYFSFSESPEQAECILVLGGDGFMLRCLHEYADYGKPFYGLHCGTIGFLMNAVPLDQLKNLGHRIQRAESALLYHLVAKVQTIHGQFLTYRGINEISLLRQTAQTAKLAIYIEEILRMKELVGDGLIISTPAGSTAYNLSAHGPIVPLNASLLAMTPNNPCRPRYWKGALLPNDIKIKIEVLDPTIRTVSLSADLQTVHDIQEVVVRQDFTSHVCLLFDEGHHLEDRILAEQFSRSS